MTHSSPKLFVPMRITIHNIPRHFVGVGNVLGRSRIESSVSSFTYVANVRVIITVITAATRRSGILIAMSS